MCQSLTTEHISKQDICTLCIFNKTKCSVIAIGIQGLLIAHYEHKLDRSAIQEILPIGVIRCAAAQASPYREPSMGSVSSLWMAEER